jgi:hypothetical protein
LGLGLGLGLGPAPTVQGKAHACEQRLRKGPALGRLLLAWRWRLVWRTDAADDATRTKPRVLTRGRHELGH